VFLEQVDVALDVSIHGDATLSIAVSVLLTVWLAVISGRSVR